MFNPYVRGQGGCCEQMFFEDPTGQTGFACPADLEQRNRDLNRSAGAGLAGEYGAGIIPGSATTIDDGHAVRLRFLLSTWNPYRVIQLSTELMTAE